MPSFRTGKVVRVLEERPGLQRVEVDLGDGPELCDGSLTSLLTNLVQTESLSHDDRRALRALVENWGAPDEGKAGEDPKDKLPR